MASERSDRPGEEQDREREIKVTDRRMFTPEGELREEYRRVGESAPEAGGGETSPPSPSPPRTGPEGETIVGSGEPSPEAPPSSGAAAGAPVEIPQTDPGPAPSLLDLVGLLAEPVPLYLGDAELPDGRSVENLEAARLHIDLLDVLRRKTAGNLTAQESAVLEDVIYRLRMRYVQKRG